MAPTDMTVEQAGATLVAKKLPVAIRTCIVSELENRIAERKQNPTVALPWKDGYMGLEDLTTEEVTDLPVVASFGDMYTWKTVFAWLGAQMSRAGHTGPVDTIGQVVRGLNDGDVTDDEVQQIAHKLGCHCHPVNEETVLAAVKAM